MRTCLGASAHLTSSTMLPTGWCSGAVLLHCEGYCLYRPQLAREAMSEARKAGALVSIDLASFECVANCKQALLELLQEGLIDLVFANEEEAFALLDEVAGEAAAAARTGVVGLGSVLELYTQPENVSLEVRQGLESGSVCSQQMLFQVDCGSNSSKGASHISAAGVNALLSSKLYGNTQAKGRVILF